MNTRMSAPETVARDQRGVVYVEFLFAFMPFFTLFLGICQVALLHTARLVVQHAAFAAVRSAIVVLEEPPADYDGAARGVVSTGRWDAQPGLGSLLARFGLLSPSQAWGGGTSFHAITPLQIGLPAQQGARMGPIRASAYMPLLVLAPNDKTGTKSTLAGTDSGLGGYVQRSLEYTRAAAIVTLQAASGSDQPAHEPVDRNAPVTVRVTYLYECRIPLVRMLCPSLDGLLAPVVGSHTPGVVPFLEPSQVATRLRFAESEALKRLTSPGARFFVIDAEATLPNQGAAYEHAKDEG